MRVLFGSAFVAFMIDQISKYVVIHMWELARIREINVLPPWLNFRYGENRGINFGLFGDGSEASRWILIGLAVAICLAVLIWIIRGSFGVKERISAGLLIGGALANVLDRLLYGYVLDFLNNSLPNWENPFVYNIADIFIFAGAIGLILFADDSKTTPQGRAQKSKVTILAHLRYLCRKTGDAPWSVSHSSSCCRWWYPPAPTRACATFAPRARARTNL